MTMSMTIHEALGIAGGWKSKHQEQHANHDDGRIEADSVQIYGDDNDDDDDDDDDDADDADADDDDDVDDHL